MSLLVLCGCQTAGKSKAWKAMTNHKIQGFRDPAQSEAYAQSVHELLDANGIENQIVTFTIAADYGFGESQMAAARQTRSAVIYRNEKSPEHPWWLMDNMHNAPVWLPDEPIAQQVQFAEQEFGVSVVAVNEPELPAVAEAPMETDWDQLFKCTHGTSFDPHSSLDKTKMAALKVAVAAKAKKASAESDARHNPRHSKRSNSEPATKSPAKSSNSIRANPALNPSQKSTPESTSESQQSSPDIDTESKRRVSAHATATFVMSSINPIATVTAPNGNEPNAHERSRKRKRLQRNA
jgi:hypothetical protein